jgi:hypothetical protein
MPKKASSGTSQSGLKCTGNCYKHEFIPYELD